MAYSDSEGSSFSEYGSALFDQGPDSSQYSLEGKLYNLESDTGVTPSEDSESEHFGTVCEIFLEYYSNSCPSAQLVSDLEDDSEDETDKVLSFSERLGVMMDNLFTNKPCFKGMATLRKSSNKITHPP